MLVADHVCGFMAEATKEDEHLVQPMDIEGIEKRAFLIPHTDKAEVAGYNSRCCDALNY